MTLDPVATNPDHYKVVFENEHVRVLDYTDQPGDRTTPHEHPNSVMYTLSSFHRRLFSGDTEMDLEFTAGTTNWLPAQHHSALNIGDTPTHVLFIELKNSPAAPASASTLGPA